MVGTARRAPLPTLIWGFASQGSLDRFGLDFAVEGWRAEPCVAQRDDRAPGEDWLQTIAAAHCITSYPVGSSGPYPRSACLRRGSHEDETHLQNGLVWPLGGTVIIHPAAAAKPRCAWLRGSVLSLHRRLLRNKSGGEIAPQRHDQLARQCDDGDAPWRACRRWPCGCGTSG
jgi:hypothetical protein